MAATVDTAGADAARRQGLRGKLWIAFVLQIAAISVATLLSVYGAWIVLRDVLINQALVDESSHYWHRYEGDRAASLPNTYNMRGYLAIGGDAIRVPEDLRTLAIGYHSVRLDSHESLVNVSDAPDGSARLYLVFEQEQVDRLAFWFGFVPLTVVLGVIYVTTWFAYRMSRRAISPVIWLANQVRAWDPKNPDLTMLEPHNLPSDADGDVTLLAGAIHGFAARLEEFVDRERNFTRDASHELRSPLTVIKVAADVLLDDVELDDFGTRSVTRIKRAARDMEALIEAFLILAREADVGLPEEDFVVNEIVTDEVEKAQALISGRPIEIRLVQDAHFALHAPPRVLAVMLSNLLRNACLYTEQGTVTVTVGPDSIRVDDTGSGMDEEELAQVFQPFFRGKGSGKGGHGVGLTIVKRLSDRFHWPVELRSRHGVGTTAIIRFPAPQPI